MGNQAALRLLHAPDLIQRQSAVGGGAVPELPTHTLPSDRYSQLGALAKQQAEEFEKERRLPAYDFTPDDAFYEFLAHNLAYRNDLDHKYIYNAGPSTQTGNFSVRFVKPESSSPPNPLCYEAHNLEVSDQLNNIHGLAAYYLFPVNRPGAPGILVFRGTEPALADILADAEQEGPGASSFQRTEIHRQIGLTLAKLKAASGNTVVTGHSLGAALAQLTTAAFPALVSKLVTFNSPGISNTAMQKFAVESAALSVDPEITHYVTRGDIVSTAGQTRLPGKTIMFDSDATRDLAMLYNKDDRLGLISYAISVSQGMIDSLAHGILPSAYIISKAVWELQSSGGLDELKALGAIMGNLHSQTLIPGSKALGAGGGKGTTWRSQPPTEQTGLPEMEQGRLKLGSALFTGLGDLFTKTLPKVILEIGSPFGSPLAPLAQEVKPILDTLAEAIRQAGGLKAFIGKLLYVDPKTGQIPYWLPELEVTAQQPK